MNKHQDDKPWKTLSSQTVYRDDPFLDVRKDEVIRPDGSEGVYSVIESKSGVMVIAQTDQDELYLIQSYRYQLQDWRWELPGGGIDSEDASPLDAAKRELEEEMGLWADTWEQLGDAYPSNNGAMADRNSIFLARDLRATPRHLDGGEAIRAPKLIPWQEVLDMVRRGELTDGESLAALFHYQLWRSTLL
jgi:8-oxo-dGTP pyrophosphatase MutT (NUDIX family)